MSIVTKGYGSKSIITQGYGGTIAQRIYGGILKVWDGMVWVKKCLKVRLDNTWKSKTLKIWDGEWKDVDTL